MKFFRSRDPRENEKEHSGRYLLIKELLPKGVRILDIGCKHAKLGSVNLDIDLSVKPDLVGDVCNLPLKDASFGAVISSEVIEHLPEGRETEALKEINRVLKKGGILILTTPNNYWFFTFTDPAYFFRRHRHYNKEYVKKMVEQNHLRVVKCFIRGGVWFFMFMTWYYIFTYTIGIRVPRFLLDMEKKDYSADIEKGSTIFLVAEKI